MSSAKQRCIQLQDLLHREVPLSETIGMVVHNYDGGQLELRADLQPNINVHGVAFGGSIYSICALAGWGLLVLRLAERSMDPRIMIASANIQYLKPVMQTIQARSHFSLEQDFDQLVDTYNEKKRARIKVPVEVQLDNGEVAARFTGEYIALARKKAS